MKAFSKIRQLVWSSVGLAVLGMISPSSAASTASTEEEIVSGFIVKVNRRHDAKMDDELQKHDARSLSKIAKRSIRVARRMSNDSHVVNVDQPMTLSEARKIAARMMKEGGVELVEPDRYIYPTATIPADPAYGSAQWHYKAPSAGNVGGINLPTAWDFTLGSGVTVAVLDTGYREHEDLKAVLKGYDFIANKTTANDGDGRDGDARDPGDWITANECGNGNSAKNSSWHGTHVMGTIAGLMNNGKGGTGVAPNVKILPLRVLGKCGGRTSDIADAMRWAAGITVPGMETNRNPARILNLSLGAKGTCSDTFQSAVSDVVNKGAIIVASAGNDDLTTVSQPANCNGVLAVTAHDTNGDNTDYANTGSEIFISAPGGGCGTLLNGSCSSIYSTWNSGTRQPGSNAYAYMNGTSMAAPHVAGAIALMLSIDPDLSLSEVKTILRATARPHPAGGACLEADSLNKCGAGLLDAGAALSKLVTGSTQPTAVISNISKVAHPRTMVTLSGNAFVAGEASIASVNPQNLTYQWTPSLNNPSSVTLQNADQLEASFTAPEKGVYVFMLEIKNGPSVVGRAVAIVRVNTAPQLDNIGAQTVEAGKELQFRLTGTDADGDPLIFHPVSLPPGATLGVDGTFSWSDATPVGTYEVSYYASDYDENSSGRTTVSVSSSGGGGGGSMDDWSLIGLLLMSFYLRFFRTAKAKGHAKTQQ